MHIKLSALGAGLAAAAYVAAPAEAQGVKTYLEISSGWANAESTTVSGGATTNEEAGSVPFSISVGAQDLIGSLGIRGDIYTSGIGAGVFTDTVDISAYYLSAIYDWPIASGGTIYAGLGGGLVHGQFDGTCVFCGTGSWTEGMKGDAPGAQAILGLRQQWGLFGIFFEGRYMYSGDISIEDQFDASYRGWAGMVGFHFGG